jgi:hypothetical protein
MSFLMIQIAQDIVMIISMKNGTFNYSLIPSNIITISSELGIITLRLYQHAMAKGQ